MPTALYYPHTTLENEALLKTSLVLFDRVQWIAPDKVYEPQYNNQMAQAAMDLIGERLVPGAKEKALVHQEVRRLVSRPLPASFAFQLTDQELANRYRMLPGKLLWETWELLLKEAKFVSVSSEPASGYRCGSIYDFETRPALGLTLMGILAYSCAGANRIGITDMTDSYRALMNFFTASGGYDLAKPGKAQTHLDEYESLINISFQNYQL